MSGDSKPELTVEAASQLGAAELAVGQSMPLRIPPGCSVPVDLMVPSIGQASAPSAEPQPPAGSHTEFVAAAGASAPSQEPPVAAG